MFNFKKKSEKGEKDKDAKESKKEEKRKREKDRKARAERTLSGRDMAGFIASTRSNETSSQPVVKREKHGLFHSLKKNDRKSLDFAETFENSYPNGQTTSSESDQHGGQSIHSRISAFENFNSPATGVGANVKKPTGNLYNGSDFQESSTSGKKKDSLSQGGEFKKVQARTYELNPQRSSVDNGQEKAAYERQSSAEMNRKQPQTTAKPVVEPMNIKPTQSQTVMSENIDSYNDTTAKRPSSKPPVAAKNRYAASPSSPSYNSSLVLTPGRKTSKKQKQVDLIPPSEKVLDNAGVPLVLPAVKPAGEGLPRLINLRRQSNGGFGFALRRSTTANNKEIYLAEPVAEAYSTCLLPGDKLLEVNGHNVENLSREKIVELVASSGSEVQLKVVPVPELAELTVRSGLDGGRVHVDENFIRSGSLARSGSKRIKKKTKTEAEVASEKEWLEAEKVWVVHKGGFSGGRMLKSSPAAANTESDPTRKVKLDHGGDIMNVDEDCVEKANPPQYDRAEDLAALRHLNEPSCLHTLRQRYGSSLIHTYAGQVLIIINPLKQMAIYDDKVIQMFRGCKQEDMPPHIYASAQTTYRNMLATNADQSLVLMGPSGSGKSINCAHLLHYFCSTSVSPQSSLTDAKMGAMLSLLGAFGNCSTRLNQNASRFTMLFTLDYDSSGMLSSGSLQTFLLQKIRVVQTPEFESNFKIFQYFLAGCNKKLRQEFHLDVALQDPNAFVKCESDQASHQRDLERWNELQRCLEVLGVSVSEMKCLWSVIAAIYHLGTAGVSMGNDNKPRFTNPAGTQRAASVLGISVEEISELIFAPPIVSQIVIRSPRRKTAGRLSSQSSEPASPAVEQPVDNQRLTQCKDALEGLAMGLYQEAFGIMVYLINRSIQEGDPRRIASINILDSAGFSDPVGADSGPGALFEDFCHNYQSERLQKFFHGMMFTQQLDRYNQENVDCTFDSVSGSPEKVVTVIDKAGQGGGLSMDHRGEKKGLLWLLDEESIFPGSTVQTFLKRLCDRQGANTFRPGPNESSFFLQHFQARQPTLYNAQGWLKLAREHPAVKQAHTLLAQSSKDDLVTLSLKHSDGLSRTRSFYRKQSITTMSVKKDSQCLQLIYQVDNVLDCIRKTHISFIRCMLPVAGAGKYDLNDPALAGKIPNAAGKMDVPLLRDQLKRAQVLDSVRLHRQGYPEHMTFGEFQHRFSILAPPESRQTQPVLDEKKAAETLIGVLDVDESSYKIGLSQIFLRAGTLAQLEDSRDETITDNLIELQAFCRGYLARKKLAKLKVQQTAIRCIQSNVRQFLQVREWEWWRLYTKIVPLLDIHRTEEELKAKTDELGTLKATISRLESEKASLQEDNQRLQQNVTELSGILEDERESGHGKAAILQEEQVLRISAEKEIESLKGQLEEAKKALQVQPEIIRPETMTTTEAVMDEAEPTEIRTGSPDRRVNDLDEELCKMSSEKRQVERMLSDKDAHNEELVREVSNLKRKIARTSGEMEDMKLLLEKSQSRNAELEKKQRRFDADLSRVQEETRQERSLKEKAVRERDLSVSERLHLEQELERYRQKMAEIRSEKERLENDLSDLGKNKGDAKAVEMASSKRQLEKKIEELDEEVDEQAEQIQLLEHAKLKLEMEIEQMKKRVQKESDRKDEDMEDMKSNYTRKIKQLEAQLEDEHHEVSQAVKARNESERKMMELRQQLEHLNDHNSSGKRYKQDLKSTKALLRDAQQAIDQLTQQSKKDRLQIKQLKNLLEDQTQASQAALKAKKQQELDLQEIQTQYDTAVRSKTEIEEKFSGLARENNELKSQIEEDEEEMKNLLQKNKILVAQNAAVQTKNAELNEAKHELQSEVKNLQSEVSQFKHRLSYFEETSVEKNIHDKIGNKVRDLEQKLESAIANSHRLEVTNERLREQLEKTEEERILFIEKESRFHQEKNKLEKKLVDIKEEKLTLEKQENEQKKRRAEKESELEEIEVVLAATKSELNMTKKRLADLQQAMEDNLHDDSDMTSESDDDDDDVTHSSMSSYRALSGSRVSSEPRSYKSYEDLNDAHDITDRLTRRLNVLDDLGSPTSSQSGVGQPSMSDEGSTASDLHV
ncbi:unconventional myosin-XVIIIa-like [Dendronephthya gigantea]|uniref:unconventional myosin-XVIIIa-like n=1 Tax=Dendronephthya gigantea TaxID=151771 RepID=UPI00106BF6CC|nr:unconventional myosin-XVIIIa-like [Dendronephthya gigantea]